MKTHQFLFLSIIIFAACIDPYEPEVGEYESTLVVDGLLSNDDQPSTVTLSRSFGYDQDSATFIGGASVIIEEENGGQTTLAETTQGVYQTDPTIFIGKEGNSYRLLIQTPDGNQFESDWELMKPAPSISDLFFEEQESIPDDPSLNPISGAQFYINTQDTENNTRFYRWEYEETWRFLLLHPEQIRVEFGSRPGNGEDEVFHISRNDFEGNQCWKTVQSTKILIATTDNLTTDVIDKFPLIFVDNRSSRLYIRYSILVKQYAITQNYYNHLRKIVESNQSTGSLFDPIPNEIFGNVRSSDGKNIPVLGYFGVGGVSKKRIFVRREELSPNLSAPFGPRCENDTISLDFKELSSKLRVKRRTLYDYLYNLAGTPIAFLITDESCTKCAANGATNQEPDFW